MDGWFPRYSPSGARLMRGSKALTLNGIPLNDDGVSGAWLTEDTLLYRKHSDGSLVLQNVVNDEVEVVAADVTHVDARNGRYVYITKGPMAVASDGRRWVDFGGGDSGCAIAEDGTIMLLAHTGAVYLVAPGSVVPQWIAPEGTNVRAVGDAFVWQARGRIYGYRLSSPGVVDLTVNAPEYWPVPCIAGGQLWVLTFTQTRLHVRPWGGHAGRIIAENVKTMYPDIVGVTLHGVPRLRIAWSSETGEPVDVEWDAEQPDDLMPPPEPTFIDSPPGTLVRDIWRFLGGESGASWVRTDPQTHSIPMTCHVDGSSLFFVKFRNPNTWERWAEHDGWIYHVEDHSGHAGGGAECYQFSDGRWLRPDMAVGEVIDCTQNHLRWFRDGAWGPWQWFPYRMRLTRHRVWSTGMEEITFVYDPGGDADTYEIYACRSDIGWWRWQEIDQRTNQLKNSGSWEAPCDEAPLTPINVRVPWPDARPILVTTPVPPLVEEPDMKSRDQFYKEFQEINAFYEAEDGLQRPGGMLKIVEDERGLQRVVCDHEAMGAWGYALLAENKSVAAVKHAIVRSQEWKDKHPNTEPPSFI